MGILEKFRQIICRHDFQKNDGSLIEQEHNALRKDAYKQSKKESRKSFEDAKYAYRTGQFWINVRSGRITREKCTRCGKRRLVLDGDINRTIYV